jgi:putative hydrolase of the HAD superfamily
VTARLTTITFDFWGTLLVDGPGSDERYRARRIADFTTILTSHGCAVKRKDLERAFGRLPSYLTEVWAQGRDVPVDEHVRAILRDLGTDLAERLPTEVIPALVEAYARPATLVPPTVDTGALGALETLTARGYTLAIVSNTMRTPGVALRKILERYGLLGFFKHATFSDEVGIRKPVPAIFALTLRAAGTDAARALHVGDDLILDVHGARTAGMRVVQVVKGLTDAGEGDGAVATPAGQAPDAVIRSLAELPDAVAALDR